MTLERFINNKRIRKIMTQRIDWGGMYENLERVFKNVEDDIHAEGILADLTLGIKPPRIYATFDYPKGELAELAEDFSEGTDASHREICMQVSEMTKRVLEIMRKHGLRSYHIDPFFKGSECLVHAYGYESSKYRISRKR